MLKILEKLTKSPSSSADLAAALEEARQALPGAIDAMADAEGKRAALLLTGTDPEIIKAEAQITAARLARDRLEAAISELERRHSEATQTETSARLKAEASQLERQAAEAARSFEKEVLSGLRTASRAFQILSDATTAVSSFNLSNSLGSGPQAKQPDFDHRTMILMSQIAPLVREHFSIVAPDRAIE